MSTTVQDNFNRGDGGLGSNWSVVRNAMTILSNQARGNTSAQNSAAVYIADTADTGVQFCKITRQDIYVGATCRSNSSGNCGYLTFVYSATVIRVYRLNSDWSLTQLGSDISCSTANNGVVEIRADGSTLTAWYNGAQQDTSRTDSTYDSTYLHLGIGAYDLNDMDNFMGGDFCASVSVTPTAIAAIASKVDPTVIAGGGSIVVTAIVSAVAGRNNPSIKLGSLILSRTIEAVTSRNNPSVRLGSIVLSRTISAVAGTVNPTIRYGSLTLTDIIEAVAGRNNPTIRLGSLNISRTISAIGSTVDPTIPGLGIIVTPAAISAVAGRVDPSVKLGSLTISDIIEAVAGRANPTVRLGSLTVSDVIEAIGGRNNPSVRMGSLVISDIIESVTGKLDPSVKLGALVITPAAIYAVTSTVDPTVIAGEASYFIELIELDSDIETLVELDSEIADPVTVIDGIPCPLIELDSDIETLIELDSELE